MRRSRAAPPQTDPISVIAPRYQPTNGDLAWINEEATEGGGVIVIATAKLRFDTPLYTVADVSRIVGVPSSTLRSWARGYIRHFDDRADITGSPLVT